MAKKSLIEKEKKKEKLVKKYEITRQSLKRRIRSSLPIQDKLTISKRLQSLPRNSAPVRLRNRCSLTGRPRSNYRDFGLSRHVPREMAHTCVLPGVSKSSW
uniref:Small ribosomal subunit protein uS14c n=1 Tax=Athyrium anisopterum TaxID=2023749 RepID=A0A222YTB9_9MONI|nr:ribosomal protein S14 [Athyrium anisopterum]YP_010885910.1 ribosomal protein S14 [Athyrium clivicola]YP_010885999.1 ribosomal protein S14 [Athyrium deltoidofrons]YP_010886088.1 ribosomal protein S14 [Athyrium iseanum]YP_010886177.1 ribosomal protein S14 [Athyrium otophorum]YP_010886266.1 ribosomal protein S14 [Athyrium reflexipinnum]YP_010886355.1 ribosomal protein S14 [Athyrium spinulosum]YP_010886444.1 ribosomal protein S14 [Athyrium vidalii]YP_010886533.1 ribosomal protein S14 [Athyri